MNKQQLISDLAAANETIHELRAVIVDLQSVISDLRRDIADLHDQNKRLLEHIMCDRRKLYGRSGE